VCERERGETEVSAQEWKLKSQPKCVGEREGGIKREKKEGGEWGGGERERRGREREEKRKKERERERKKERERQKKREKETEDVCVREWVHTPPNHSRSHELQPKCVWKRDKER